MINEEAINIENEIDSIEEAINFENEIDSIIENLKKNIEYSFKKLNSEKRQLKYLKMTLKEQSKIEAKRKKTHDK